MDFNKLIKDIIKAAKEDRAIYGNDPKSTIESIKLITTLKLEVRVSTDIDGIDEAPRNSTKLVLLTIND